MSNYEKNLLEQLRLFVIKDGNAEIDDVRLQKALTINEELKALGFSLTVRDLTRLARSESMDLFMDRFRSLLSDVKAKPMYPGFPQQVMEMEEAQFRFHQLCHYWSTYGVEFMAELFGQDYHVKKGWLPEVEDPQRQLEDKALLDAKFLELIDEQHCYDVPVNKLLNKTERLTAAELQIVREALKHVDVASMDFSIPFKQNMMPVFYELFMLDEDRSRAGWMKLCQHTGDVLKCLDYTLTRCDYHFTSSQKRRLVDLIESYPVADWKANVILSNKKARRTILVLQYLSYNRFSKSPKHKEVVRQLRNGELTSWEGQVKAMMDEKNEGVLDFIAQRSGMLLRWTNWLIKSGYDSNLIEERLMENAESLSTRTLVTAATLVGRDESKQQCYQVLENVLYRKLQQTPTPLRGHKVYVNPGRLDLAHSMLLAKGDEAGYVRNGLAYRIPEDVENVRFFVYWNDEERVDIDLHASANDINGQVVNVGWNEDFKGSSICHSGDITHSDAAEYIDASMNGNLSEVSFNVNLYAGKENFAAIKECYIGMMAVSKLNQKVKLYDIKNCFFSNDIKSKKSTLNYGYLSVKDRYLCLDGTPTQQQWMDGVYTVSDHRPSKLSLEKYLQMLLSSQNCQISENSKECDMELVMEKPEKDGQISLIDNNFFF